MDPTNLLGGIGTAGKSGGDGSLFGMTMGGLLLSLFFSGIGFLYFRYGRANNNMRTILIGVALMVFPYFVNDTMYMALIGFGLMLVPWILDKFAQ